MGRFRERFIRFMQGRYGTDQLSNFLTVLALILLVVEFFVPRTPVRSTLNSLALLALVYSYWRMFSKNHYKRRAENEWFLKYYNRVRLFFARKKSHMQQRKTHRIFKCPSCRQSIRIPKGKGKIAITCPKCHTEFIRRT